MSLKCAISVSIAAGAIAAPILLISVTPLSITFPVVTCVIFGPVPFDDNIAHPAPVTVHCADGVR